MQSQKDSVANAINLQENYDLEHDIAQTAKFQGQYNNEFRQEDKQQFKRPTRYE